MCWLLSYIINFNSVYLTFKNWTKRKGISLSTISELETDIVMTNNNKNSWNENEYEMNMRKITTKKYYYNKL